ncbi:MAG: protein O-mannosyl-transferase family [Chloroflexota bacterium]
MFDRLRQASMAAPVAAIVTSLLAFAVYVRTVLPGVSVGDWAEAEMIPARLGVMHPTGYPLYTLLMKAFTTIPLGSFAWRANVFSGVSAAVAVGVAVLIMIRLHVRPVIAAAAALCLAFTGTLWQEATFSEMNALHLVFVALLLHRALVWRDERRDRDLLIGALLAGLCVSNHGLAITVVPIVMVFVLVDARREIAEFPWILVQAAGAFTIGLLPYLYIPFRAMLGPDAVYGSLTTWNGFFNLISGAQFRGDMHFLSLDSVRAAWAAMPHVIDHLISTSNVIFLALGLFGIVLLVVRDRWFGLLLIVLGVINVYFYANYLGDLFHYLLATWLILAIGLAISLDRGVSLLVGVAGTRASVVQFAALALPVLLLTSNWTTHDQSANREAEEMADQVFAALPQDAVLITYWDVLTTLSYKHCMEGVRPDVSLRAYDDAALVTCDPVAPLAEVARTRPVYALMVFDDTLAERTKLTPVPAGMVKVPWGQRYPQLDRPLYRMYPPDQAP